MILAEAFSKPNNIELSARNYSVLPEQIRRWRTMFASLPVLPEDNSDEYNGNQTNRQLSQILNKKTAHQGVVRKSVGEFEMLRSTFDGLRQQDRCCTIRMLAIELKKVAGNENVTLATLSKRVNRWMVKEGIVFWRVTHVAQNTRLNQARVLEFVTYDNQQIQNYGMDPRCIVNIDEMNINFDLHGS